MAQEKEVGSGGDFDDYDEAIEWLYDQIPLNDDYIFDQISDISQTTYTQRILTANVGASVEINGNGYTLTTSTTGVNVGVTTLNGLLVKIHHMIINMTTSSTANAITVTGITSDGTEYYNNYIYSLVSNSPTNNKTGLIPGNRTLAYFNAYNNKFYNLHVGIGATSGGGGDVEDADKRYVKNNSLFNCGSTSGYAVVCEYPFQAWIQYINTSLLRNDGITGRDVDFSDTTCEMINCATSDESTFEDLEDLYPDQITDCLDDLTASEHLRSTVYTSDKFLKPKKCSGTGIYNGGIDPVDPTHDYDGIEYGFNGYYPIGAYQYIAERKNRIIGVV